MIVCVPHFRDSAFWLQEDMHLAQLMHSWSPTYRTSIRQLRTQAPQELQRFSSTFTLTSASLLNMP